MTRGGKIFLGFALGAIFFVFSLYGVIDAALYKTPVRSWLWYTLALGVVLIALSAITLINDKKSKAEQAIKAAEAEKARIEHEAEQAAKAEKARKEREARIRAEIEAEEAELDRLLDGPYKINVFRLTSCISPTVQENIFMSYEDEKVYFAGDDKDEDAVWIVDKYDRRLGRLPKDAAARYQQEGAVAVFIKELDNEDNNTIPYVRVFWKENA